MNKTPATPGQTPTEISGAPSPRIQPLVTGLITIDPTDPEWTEILSTLCLTCGPIAHVFQKAGYDIRRRAEQEQGFVLMWLLSLYRDHGKEWRNEGQIKLNEIQSETLSAVKGVESSRDRSPSDKTSAAKPNPLGEIPSPPVLRE